MPFSYFPRFGSRVRPLLALLAFCVSLSAQVMPAARRGDGASLPLMPWPAEVQVQTGELPITQKFTLALRGEGAGDPRVVESARLASDLAPLRYVGVQLGGSILSNSVSYEAGYFDGSEDGSNGNFQWTQSHELAVRGFFLPFAKTGVKAAHQVRFMSGLPTSRELGFASADQVSKNRSNRIARATALLPLPAWCGGLPPMFR